MIPVKSGPFSINPLGFVFFVQSKIGHHVILGQKKNRIIHHFKFLLDINVFDPVDVGTLGSRHVDVFDGKSGVAYPKIAFKSQFIFAPWIKNDVVTPFIVNKRAVPQHIIIDIDSRFRQRTCKAFVEKSEVIVINVKIRIQIVHKSQNLLVAVESGGLVGLCFYLDFIYLIVSINIRQGFVYKNR